MDATRLQSLLECDCQLVVRERTTTTNDEVLACATERACAGELRGLEGLQGLREALPLVVVSGEQTAGRGRLGRVWASPAGGVYLSVLVEGADDASCVGGMGGVNSGGGMGGANSRGGMGGGTSGVSLASLSPLTALAVHEALQGLSSRKLFIKWPNDLISDQGKLAGILVEARKGSAVLSGVQGPASDATFAVIGIGINVKRPAGDAFAGAAWLSEGAERRLELEEVAAAVINRVLAHYENWLGVGRSFAPFAARYQEHMALLGEGVCVRDAAGGLVASGEVKGVDEAGQLVVAGELGVVSVAAGEVTLRDPARPRFSPQNKTSV